MKTVNELLQTGESITGYDLKQSVLNSMKSENIEEVQLAEYLYASYFAEAVEKSYVPLKFVYYNVILKNPDDEENSEVIVRRDQHFSPRAKYYFDTEVKCEDDEMREIVINKQSVKGSELKEVVARVVAEELTRPVKKIDMAEVQRRSFRNLSIQLARYINTYFIESENPIKDDIYYKVNCKEYGTATVYRDLEKSPRVSKK